MEMPTISNVARDEDRNITYDVLAYRQLSEQEVTGGVGGIREDRSFNRLPILLKTTAGGGPLGDRGQFWLLPVNQHTSRFLLTKINIALNLRSMQEMPQPGPNRVFRDNLRRRLTELQISQRELAKALDASDAYVSQLINGESSPTLDTVEKLSKALHANWLYLLTPVQSEEFSEIS